MTVGAERAVTMSVSSSIPSCIIRRANWQKLQRNYRRLPTITKSQPKEMAEALVAKVKGAVNGLIPTLKESERPRGNQWSERVQNLKSRMRSLRRFYQRSITEVQKNKKNVQRRKTNFWGRIKKLKRKSEINLWRSVCRWALGKHHIKLSLKRFTHQHCYRLKSENGESTRNLVLRVPLPSDRRLDETDQHNSSYNRNRNS